MTDQVSYQQPAPADAHARAQLRWRDATPEQGLTWGTNIAVDAFIQKVIGYASPNVNTAILEIGPGYGRLLRSLISSGAMFRSYLGVDLSSKNVAHLRESFPGANLAFQVADVESADFDGAPFDLMCSSLTFKHLYPSCEAALVNIARQMTPGGIVVFDLREDEDPTKWERVVNDPDWLEHFGMTREEIARGVRGYFEPQDRRTFIRLYTKSELPSLLRRSGFDLVALDEVRHTPERVRLLVVGRIRP